MHLGKFHAAIATLTEEYSEGNINGQMQSIIQQLDSLAANPGNADVAKAFRIQVELMREILAKSSLNEPYPTLAALLDSIDARQYIGDELFQNIEDVIAKNGMTPQLAASALRELLVKVAQFYADVTTMDTAFTRLQVEYEDIDPGEGEIGISIPKSEERLLTDLADAAKAWNKALRPFVELCDPEHNPIGVRTISSSDWQFYLTAAPAVYLAVSTAVSQMNDLLRKLIETRQLIGQLTEKGMSETTMAAVVAEADSILADGSRAIAEKIVDENSPQEPGRANELKTEMTTSLKFIARQMANNVTIEVRYLPPEMPKAAENDEENRAEVGRVRALVEVAAQIGRNMDLLRLDPKAQELLNLPPPDEDAE